MVNKQQWKVTFLLCTSDLPQWEIFLHWQENALLFFFFLVNVENLKMYLQLFVTTSHLYRAVQAQRVSVSSTEVPRSIKQSLSDTWKRKGGFASLQPCSPSKAPAWLCGPGRHRVVGKGQSHGRPSPHFHLLLLALVPHPSKPLWCCLSCLGSLEVVFTHFYGAAFPLESLSYRQPVSTILPLSAVLPFSTLPGLSHSAALAACQGRAAGLCQAGMRGAQAANPGERGAGGRGCGVTCSRPPWCQENLVQV